MISLDPELQCYVSSLIPIKHGFGTKQFGDGRNADTLKKLLELQKTSVKIIIPQQTHSTNIKVIQNPKSDISMVKETDGLITKEENIFLSVITADCVPIIFVDPVEQIIGISHQGWKGTLRKLPAKMIDEMIQLGAKTQNIRCVLGPSIGDCCYEIYGERLEQFQQTFKTDSIFRRENDKHFLNLYYANLLTLTEKNVLFKNIEMSSLCTSTDKDRFWSYHRDKKILGEMFCFVML